MRKITVVLSVVILVFGLTSCAPKNASRSISSFINSSVNSSSAVSSASLQVEYKRNIITGSKINVAGVVTYKGVYADELNKKVKETVKSVAVTSDRVGNIQRGEIDFEGVSAGKKITASEAYYGDKDKKVKIQKVLKDIE